MSSAFSEYRRLVFIQVDAHDEGTVETPGVQRTNTDTETTVAHDAPATTRADETKRNSDQEYDQTTAAIDDMFGLDLVHRRKPPTRLRFELKHSCIIMHLLCAYIQVKKPAQRC